ncbi:MAG: hypothetical protein HRU14_01740 [Planctomycetes bacterium]|nr:hypothetical protein [Planctomycetota bacterium]
MRHPFQRASNDKDTVRTPFQVTLVRFIETYSDEGERMSGRKLSNLLGKSANHISQMLNDGFVPSGPAIVDMASVLKLTSSERDGLIRAAMETKASQRSRDNFWINETWRMLAESDAEKERLVGFLAEQGLLDGFLAWSDNRPKRKEGSRNR